jgi:glycosyltransferase involved in cell wall biosynthesis
VKLALLAHHVAPIAPPFAGGVESFTWYLARWLAERGHEVVMFAPPGSHVPGVDVRHLELELDLSTAARNDIAMPPTAFMDAHHAYQQLMVELVDDSEGFDLVHSHSLHYLPVAMAPILPMPSLLTLHTPPTPWLESALRARTGPVPRLSAVSHATARMWSGIARVDHVVPNGVDLSSWTLGPGGDHAVWCGRMVPEKAPHLAIDAARLAGLPLRIAGPIVDGGYWEREVAHRLGDDVTYAGHLGHRELSALVRTSRVALLTPAWEEPFGLAAAEAIASGTPVAAFSRGGLRTVVGPAAGCLATPGDVPALAEAIRSASALPRRGVRAHAERHLGIDVMGERYEALYGAMLERRATPVPLAS